MAHVYPTDDNDAYQINKKYDRVRDILMDNYDDEVWEKSKSQYTYDKFKDYSAVLDLLDNSVKKEFKQRFIREMKRAADLGELDRTVFTKEDEEKLDKLLRGNNRKKRFLSKLKRTIRNAIKKYRYQ